MIFNTNITIRSIFRTIESNGKVEKNKFDEVNIIVKYKYFSNNFSLFSLWNQWLFNKIIHNFWTSKYTTMKKVWQVLYFNYWMHVIFWKNQFSPKTSLYSFSISSRISRLWCVRIFYLFFPIFQLHTLTRNKCWKLLSAIYILEIYSVLRKIVQT